MNIFNNFGVDYILLRPFVVPNGNSKIEEFLRIPVYRVFGADPQFVQYGAFSSGYEISFTLTTCTDLRYLSDGNLLAEIILVDGEGNAVQIGDREGFKLTSITPPAGINPVTTRIEPNGTNLLVDADSPDFANPIWDVVGWAEIVGNINGYGLIEFRAEPEYDFGIAWQTFQHLTVGKDYRIEMYARSVQNAYFQTLCDTSVTLVQKIIVGGVDVTNISTGEGYYYGPIPLPADFVKCEIYFRAYEIEALKGVVPFFYSNGEGYTAQSYGMSVTGIGPVEYSPQTQKFPYVYTFKTVKPNKEPFKKRLL